MQENQINKEVTLDDVLTAVNKASGYVQEQFDEVKKEMKDQFDDVKKEMKDMKGRLSVVEIKVDDIESTLTKIGDDIKQVRASVEKTADILEQKQMITEPEKKMIYTASSPFALPA